MLLVVVCLLLGAVNADFVSQNDLKDLEKGDHLNFELQSGSGCTEDLCGVCDGNNECVTTCTFTIDNEVEGIWYDGVALEYETSPDQGWYHPKSFSFPAVDSDDARLVITGYEYSNCNGCACSGLLLTCTGGLYGWDGFTSDLEHWAGYGSDDEIDYTEEVEYPLSAPCQSTSGFSMSGSGSATKIWPSGGEKYALFVAHPSAGLVPSVSPSPSAPVPGSITTCTMTLDNIVTSISYNGEELAYTTAGVDWYYPKTFSFAPIEGSDERLVIEGYEYINCNGCQCSGLLITCDGGPDGWDGFTSNTHQWVAYGDEQPIVGEDFEYSEPCVSTSGFWMAGSGEAIKIWASGGEKYAIFQGHPYYDVDECEEDPCQNDGVCTDEINGYSCECAAGFDGDSCENDIDDCLDNTACQNDGVCTDGINSFSCECASGWTGDDCSVIDYCYALPCANGGTCTNGEDGYECACVAGYEGINCQDEIDECATSPCVNGACEDQLNGYQCTCDVGYDGINCDNDIDDCAGVTCLNGGTCHDGIGEYTCECVLGYDGVNCQNDWLTLYSTGHFGDDDCGASTFNFYITEGTVIRRLCEDCVDTHQVIYYKRLASVVDVDMYDLFFGTWVSTNNLLHTHFELYSTYEDAIAGTNAWSYCDYDEPDIGFPRNCGPESAVEYQWTSYVNFNTREHIQVAVMSEGFYCPVGSEVVGYIGADIPGCGLDACSARYDLFSIEECHDSCVDHAHCLGFNWAPGTDKNHDGELVCTRYSSATPTSTWSSQIFCALNWECPSGSHAIGNVGADIPGCGIDSCGARYQLDSIEECQSWCQQDSSCVAFTWAPGTDKNHIGNLVCTRYTSTTPTSTWSQQVFCALDDVEDEPATMVFGSVNTDHNSADVTVAGTFVEPIVVCGAVTYDGGDATVPRCVSTSNDDSGFSFTAQLLEPAKLDGTHAVETIPYVVGEVGEHYTETGAPVKFGYDFVEESAWAEVEFETAFETAPAVIASVNDNANGYAVVRLDAITATGFKFRVQLEEKHTNKAEYTSVAWMAIADSTGEVSTLGAGVQYWAQRQNEAYISHSWSTVSRPSMTTALVLASIGSYYGTDSATARYRNLDDDSVQLRVWEDNTKDSETNHLTERFNIVVIGAADVSIPIFSSSIDDIDECAVAPCQNGATCIDHIGSYQCVCAGFYTGFDCEIAPPSCSDWGVVCKNGGVCSDASGTAVCECADMYSGEDCSFGGAAMMFGSVELNLNKGNSIDIDISAATLSNPVVVCPHMSYDGSDPAVARCTGASTESFNMRLIEPSNIDFWHTDEIVPYVVGQAGEHNLPDGNAVKFGVADDQGGSTWTTVVFDEAFSAPPAVFASVSDDVNEFALVRIQDRTATSFSFKVQLSEKTKTNGLPCKVSWAAFENTNDQLVDLGNGNLHVVKTVNNKVTHSWSTISFPTFSFTSESVVLGQIASNRGDDPAVARYRNLDDDSVQVMCKEDWTKDGELNHIPESFSIVVVQEAGVVISLNSPTPDWLILYSTNPDDEVASNFNDHVVAGSIVRRLCGDCVDSHKEIYYKRLTSTDGVDMEDLFIGTWASTDNALHVDFELYSTYDDAVNGNNPWKFCNYDDTNIGFPRDCGPECSTWHNWNSLTHSNSRQDYQFATDNLQHQVEEWVNLFSTGSFGELDVGTTVFNDYVIPGTIIRRTCVDCVSTHSTIYYKRTTPGVDVDFHELFLGTWASADNELGVDFELYSSFSDAVNEVNGWSFCNYDDSGIGFPRDCGPSGSVGNQWNSLSRGGVVNYEIAVQGISRGYNSFGAICEHDEAVIDCPVGTIEVSYAVYGRWDSETCPHSAVSDTSCELDVTSLFASECNGEHTCTVDVENNVFGNDPCFGTYKYAVGYYRCVGDELGPQPPNPCDDNNGYCYSESTCSFEYGQVVCGPCPDGMHGDGRDCSDNDEDVTPFVCTDRIFLTKGQGKGATGLFSVPHDDTDDLDDGVVLIGEKVNGVNYNGAGYDPVTDFIYAINPWDHMIWRVAMNGHATEMGALAYAPGVAKITGSIYAGDMNADGVFVILATPARRLAYIDLAQSPPVVTKSIHVYYADNNAKVRTADIAFGPDGMIYCFDGKRRKLAVIDPETGAARSLGHNAEPKGWGALGGSYFDKYGNYYGLDNKLGRLYKWKDVAGADIDTYSNQHEIMINDIAPSSTNDGCSCQSGTEEILPGINYKIPDSCDGEEVVLSCEEGQVIKLRGINYGRRDRNTCPVDNQMDHIRCDYQNAREVVLDLCDGQQSCTIPVGLDFFDDYHHFGDPCPGTAKYLSGHYQCREPSPCQNGQQDGDEEGVDCGGSCSQSCSSNKVTICHKPGTPAEQTKKVNVNAVDAFLAQGGYYGPCNGDASDSDSDYSLITFTFSMSADNCNTINCYSEIEQAITQAFGNKGVYFAGVGNKNGISRSARDDDNLVILIAVTTANEEEEGATDSDGLTLAELEESVVVAIENGETSSDILNSAVEEILIEQGQEIDCAVNTCINVVTEPIDCAVMECFGFDVTEDENDENIVDPGDSVDNADDVTGSTTVYVTEDDDSDNVLVMILAVAVGILLVALGAMIILYRKAATATEQKVFSNASFADGNTAAHQQKLSSNTSFNGGPTIASFNDIIYNEGQTDAANAMLFHPGNDGTSSGNAKRGEEDGFHWRE
jgi:Notch-like protein